MSINKRRHSYRGTETSSDVINVGEGVEGGGQQFQTLNEGGGQFFQRVICAWHLSTTTRFSTFFPLGDNY